MLGQFEGDVFVTQTRKTFAYVGILVSAPLTGIKQQSIQQHRRIWFAISYTK